MKDKIYATFQMYNKYGRRCCVFAKHLNEEKLIVTMWTVSKEDNLDKKTAWSAYFTQEHWGLGYLKEMMGITAKDVIIDCDKDRPRGSFLSWCDREFYMPYQEIYTKTKFMKRLWTKFG